MKKIIPILSVVLLLCGCKSVDKLVSQGNYDAAIDKSIKKIVKGKAKDEEKSLLDKSYRLANQRDNQRIEFLMAERKKENWDAVYHLYRRLSARQEKIQKVIPFQVNGITIDYQFIDYNERIVEAKSNAADYFYKRGLEQMELGTKEHYRSAYGNFLKAKNYRAESYPDIDKQIMDAKLLGTSRVLIEMDNPNKLKLPPDYFEQMMSLKPGDLNSNWVEFYLQDSPNIEFDYYVVLVLLGIDIIDNDEQIDSYRREKTIEEFEYKKDRRGRIEKDSLGNEIKIYHTRKADCIMVVSKQSRAATIFGEIEFYYAKPYQLIQKEPISATTVFENVIGRARGDHGALLPEDLELLHKPVLPFPDELSMLYDCSEIMKENFSDAIYSNRNLMP